MKKETRGRKPILTPRSKYHKFHVSLMNKIVKNKDGIIQPKYILYWEYGFKDVFEIQRDSRFEVSRKSK